MDAAGTNAAKRQLRSRLLAARAARAADDPNGERRRADAAAFRSLIMDHAARSAPSAPKVCAYLPTGTEPPIDDALNGLHESGAEIWVPISLPDRVLEWVRWTPGAEVEISAFGIREPVGPREGSEVFLQADLRLIPALAIDARGIRLGYGGGYYDAALAAVREAGSGRHDLGLCFEEELLGSGRVPAAAHDARLPMICTEAGFTPAAG